MTKTDSLRAVEIQMKFMSISGMWNTKNPTLINRIMFCIYWTSVSSIVTMCFVVCFYEFETLDKLSAALTLLIPHGTYLLKDFIFQLSKQKFRDMIDTLKEPIFKKYPDHLDIRIQQLVKSAKAVTIFYQSVCFAVIILYACKTFFTANSELPVDLSMFDLGHYKYVLYALQVSGMFFAVWNNCCLDTLASSFMAIAACHFNILNTKLLHVRSSALHERNVLTSNSINEPIYPISNDNDYKINLLLKECVQHHIAIIRFVTYIELNFSVGFLIQLLGSILSICNVGFQLAHTSPLSLNFIIFILFFVAMMTQWAIYCWFGNELTINSIQIRDACYMCDWPNCGSSVRKSLMIIMERSKRPLYVTAGKLTVLSLGSFTGVIRSSYSYFALMQRLYSDDK